MEISGKSIAFSCSLCYNVVVSAEQARILPIYKSCGFYEYKTHY